MKLMQPIKAFITLIIDSAEVAGLSDRKRHVRRCTEGHLAWLDALAVVACAVMPFTVYLSEVGRLGKCESTVPEDQCEPTRERMRAGGEYAWFALVLLGVSA